MVTETYSALDAFIRDWPEKPAQRNEWKVIEEIFVQQWDNVD